LVLSIIMFLYANQLPLSFEQGGKSPLVLFEVRNRCVINGEASLRV
jgi:hypothetical protein